MINSLPNWEDPWRGARQGFLNTVTLEPCLSYKKSRWIVTLLLARQNLLENGIPALSVNIFFGK